MKRIFLSFGMTLLTFALTAQSAPTPESLQPKEDGVYALISTDVGDLLARLEYKKAPVTVSSFVGLAEGSLNKTAPGKPFFDGLTFHRYVANFVVQGGDPKGNGAGGPGYSFPDEFNPELRHSEAGILSMANSGPDTNGSQFFITLRDLPNLDDHYSVFGKVVAGLPVLKSIRAQTKILSVKIIRKGAEAEAFQVSPDQFTAAVQTLNAKRLIDRENAIAALFGPGSRPVQTTASGIKFVVRKDGIGPKPTRGQRVQVMYEGKFLNGDVFDASKPENPLVIQAGTGQVIKGWDETLLDMRKGEKRTIVLPPELAYGNRGAGGVIPPNAWLAFDVEIVQLEN